MFEYRIAMFLELVDFEARISQVYLVDDSITRVIEKFCHILVRTNLQRVFYLTEALQVIKNNRCGWKYCGAWCADTLYITTFRV